MMSLGVTNSWTLSFIREWWPYLSPTSMVRWRDYHLREARGQAGDGREIALTLRAPIRGSVSMREISSDINTFREIAVEEVYRDALSSLKTCATMIDLGANIGLTSLYLATRFPRCRILAVEPDRDNFRLLGANLQPLVAKGRCRLLQAAVWAKEQTLVMGGPNDPDAHWMRQACDAPCLSAEPEVVGLSMDAILIHSGFESVDLLKVDVEGAEVEMLSGSLEWLRRVSSIAIEFHGETRTASEFDRKMRDFGFDVRDSNSHTVSATRRTPG